MSNSELTREELLKENEKLKKEICRLEKRDEWNSKVIDQSPSVFEMYDITGLQIIVNKAYEILWGFPASHTLNKFNVLESKEVKDTGLFKYIERAYKGETITVPEYKFDPTGETEAQGIGRIRWLSTKIYPLKDKNEKVQNIVITHIDVTKRKEAEIHLKESENKYRLLVENQTDLIVKVDLDGRFLFASRSYCIMFGKSEKELLGNSFMPLVHEDDQKMTEEKMKKLFKEPYTCYIEQRALTKDGWRWLAWNDTAILNNKGDVIEILGLGRDVTLRKKAEIELKKYQDNLENLVKERTKDLTDKNKELDKAVKVFVGRELKIKELQKIIGILEKQV